MRKKKQRDEKDDNEAGRESGRGKRKNQDTQSTTREVVENKPRNGGGRKRKELDSSDER